tara:strand:- start:837 stop:1529 length:693 start_codon:yes stop_codon:yes gene_type:complete
MYKLDYLKNSLRQADEQRDEYTMTESIQIYIKDKFKNRIDLGFVIERVVSTIPHHLLKEIDSIFVGMFDEFDIRDTNAMYKDGAIYLSSDQEDEADVIDDIIHEIAHSLEVPYGGIIYGDGDLEKEFLAKRARLYHILDKEDLKPSAELFQDASYSLQMDDYLYKTVGYDRLNFIAASYNLFTSAYSATALREYFSNGFEYYYLDNPSYLKEICPVLYKKIKEISENETY